MKDVVVVVVIFMESANEKIIFASCSNQMMLFEMQHFRVSYSPFDTGIIQEFCFCNWPKPKSTTL